MPGKPNFCIDLPSGQNQIHMHGSQDGTVLTGGYLKDNASNQPVGGHVGHTYMNGYECAMTDLFAQQAGWKKTSYK